MRSKRGTISPLIFVVVGLLILLPILYGLSTGPVMWLSCKGYLSKTLSNLKRN
jgi:biotin transporter BioY